METQPAKPASLSLTTGVSEARELTPIAAGLLSKVAQLQALDAKKLTPEQLAGAVSLRSLISQQIEAADEQRLRLGKPFRDGLAGLNAEFNDGLIDPLTEGKKQIDAAIKAHSLEQTRLANEEAARLRAEAEAKRKADEERALAEAQRLESEGKTAEAEQVLEQAAEAPPAAPIVAPAPRAPMRGVSGIGGAVTMRTVVKFSLDPELEPEAAIALVPKHFQLEPAKRLDEKSIRAKTSGKDGVRSIPGLKIWEEQEVAGTRGG